MKDAVREKLRKLYVKGCTASRLEDFARAYHVSVREVFRTVAEWTAPSNCKGCEHVVFFSSMYPCNICSRRPFVKDMYEPSKDAGQENGDAAEDGRATDKPQNEGRIYHVTFRVDARYSTEVKIDSGDIEIILEKADEQWLEAGIGDAEIVDSWVSQIENANGQFVWEKGDPLTELPVSGRNAEAGEPGSKEKTYYATLEIDARYVAAVRTDSEDVEVIKTKAMNAWMEADLGELEVVGSEIVDIEDENSCAIYER